jgi:hypothetical protein
MGGSRRLRGETGTPGLTGGFMLKSIFGICGAAAVIGAVLIPTAASAAVTARAAGGPTGGDPDTTMTFAVTTGALTMTAPATANLGSGAPGTTITGALGTVAITDLRASLTAAWTATATSTAFTTGAATPDETVPAADATYTPGTISHTGTLTTTGFQITLSAAPQTVVTGTAGVGNNTASWDPTIAVAVPAQAVTGTYTATLTQSVA